MPSPYPDLSKFRLTLDYAEDYSLLSALFDLLPQSGALPTRADVFEVLRNNPDLLHLNRDKIGARAIDPKSIIPT